MHATQHIGKAIMGIAALLLVFSSTATAENYSKIVATDIIIDGQTYTNATHFKWETECIIPDGGVKWNGSPEYIYMDDYSIDEVVKVPIEDKNGEKYVDNQIVFMVRDNVDFYTIEQLAAKYGFRIVGYLAPTGDFVIESVETKDYYQLQEVVNQLKQETYLVTDTVALRYTFEFDISFYPSDPWGNASWDQSAPGGYNWAVEQIGAPAAWDYADCMYPLNIGIIDSTFFSDHPDLTYLARYNRNLFSNGSDNAFDILYRFANAANSLHLLGEKYLGPISAILHGTHVAGTFAATYDNGIGISGVFPRGQIVAISTEYQGNTFDMTDEEIVNAISSDTGLLINISDPYLEKYYILVMRQHNVKVINMSLGHNFTADEGFDLTDPEQNNRYSQMMRTRYTTTYGFGLYFDRIRELHYDFVFVNSYGNMEIKAQANYWPEFVDNDYFQKRLIVVGSYGRELFGSLRFSSFSNYGETVDILAPGEDIYSTLYDPITGEPTYGNKSDYWDSRFAFLKKWEGTSMAAPHVAGTAAMVWSISPDSLTGPEVKSIILNSTSSSLISGHPDDTVNGNPRQYPTLNAEAAVEKAREEARKAAISGKVTDALTGLTLPGSTVQLIENGSVIDKTTVDQNGMYSFWVKPGLYEIRCEQAGYMPQTVSITIKSAESQTHNFALTSLNAGTGTVTGHIQAEDGTPIAEAMIQVENASIPAQTDANGDFTLSSPSGRISLQISKDGFESVTRSANVYANQITDIGTVTLSKKNVIHLGDYLTLGTYLGEPIVWRCVDIDENGPLMLSDQILCLKAFDASGKSDAYHKDDWVTNVREQYGSNCWSDSNLRQWLNSSDEIVAYSHCPPTASAILNGYNAYDSEAGFLHAFTQEELSNIKTVTQRIYINDYDTKRNGYCDGGTSELRYNPTKSDVDYSQYYYQNVTDRIFLLTPSQANAVYRNFDGYLKQAYPTQAAVENSNYKDTSLSAEKTYPYWLGIPSNLGASYEHIIVISQSGLNYPRAYEGIYGVRPAFYLDGYTVEP